MSAIIVAGTDTGIGKTVFSAGLVQALGGTYWKPVQSGIEDETDSQIVTRLSGRPAFRQAVPAGGVHVSAVRGGSILRSLSEAVFEAGTARSGWDAVKARAEARLNEEEHGLFCAAERSCAGFAGFFEGFARAGSAGAT